MSYTAFEVKPKQTLLAKKQPLLKATLRVFDAESRWFCFFLKILNLLSNQFQRPRPFEDIAKRGFTCFTWNGKVVLPITECAFVVEPV